MKNHVPAGAAAEGDLAPSMELRPLPPDPEAAGPRVPASCACLDDDAVDCWRSRHDLPMATFEDVANDGGPCDCSCHEEVDDQDDDGSGGDPWGRDNTEDDEDDWP